MNPTNQTLPAKASGSAPSYSVDGTPAFLSLDASGNLRVTVSSLPLSPVSPRVKKTAVGSVNSNTQVVAANGQNVVKFNVCKLRTAYTSLLNPIVTDGNGGATIWGDEMQALASTLFGSNDPAVTCPDYIAKTSAGSGLWINPGGQTVYYFISYWDSDAS